LARYIAVADTIDAMTSSRPYRAALTIDEVHVELTRGVGKQFDPDIVTPLIAAAGWQQFMAVFAKYTEAPSAPVLAAQPTQDVAVPTP